MIYEEVEIISIHIPKSAGTSFRKIIEQLYRDSIELYYGGEPTLRLWDGNPLQLKSTTRALHGHFRARSAYLKQCPKAKLITWVRHPVDRIISYYNYWSILKPHGNPLHDRFLKERPNLVEFSKVDYMQNEWFAYFGDLKPKDFDFVGIVEQFESEIRRLMQLMGWGALSWCRVNQTASKKSVSEETKSELAGILSREVEAYDEIVSNRTA